jgi:uncharacterized membrane protein
MSDSTRRSPQASRERKPLVIITGSSGLIGSGLAPALGDRFEVVGLDLKCTGSTGVCIETDLTPEASLGAALDRIERKQGTRIASVIHLAAYFDLSGEPHPLYEKLNVGGTRHLLRALRRRFEVEQFLYASSLLVHAPTRPGIPITESSPMEAKWAYPQSKIAGEEAVGAERIITSEVSGAWPVSDAGLGALVYLLEIVTGALGGRNRWRTMPWAVVLFGMLIVPLGAVSIFFIVIQSIVIGTWCSLCLVAALAMLLQIPYANDELLATGQFPLDRRREGKPLLRIFNSSATPRKGRENPRRVNSPAQRVPCSPTPSAAGLAYPGP